MYLVKAKDRKSRKNEEGQTLFYWRLGEKGKDSLSIGWHTEKEAQQVLMVAKAKATLEASGL
ncbi:MAG TPA: hypothetical protein PKY30_22285, partial [Myxococcota bacterium]|nr:hypothetical protein [Myxococcota bacterium]